jgi:hypothetical protein
MPKHFTPAMAKAISDACDKPVLTGVQPLVVMDMMGGGWSQDPALASRTALPIRPNYWFIILAQWRPEITGPQGRDVAVAFVRDLWKVLFELSVSADEATTEEKYMLDTHSNITDLINDTMLMGQQAKIAKSYGDNTDRLHEVKIAYDPAGVFGTAYKK